MITVLSDVAEFAYTFTRVCMFIPTKYLIVVLKSGTYVMKSAVFIFASTCHTQTAGDRLFV